METPSRSRRADVVIAAVLATAMTAAWAWVARVALAAGRLPDTDDLLRLQQVRDWLGGQAFGDLHQYRLGVDGVSMHWSRLPDLVPAALVSALTPFVGSVIAERAMLIAWPGLLLAAFVFLAVRVTRCLGGAGMDAAVVAVLSYPATTLFAPGRIDHHGLQLVVLLGMVRALATAPTRRAGAVAGMLAATGIAIGMETVPMLAALLAVATWHWSRDRSEDARMVGLAIGLAAGLAVAALVFRTDSWAWRTCDGFGRNSALATAIGTAAIMGMAVAGRLPVGRSRWMLAALLGVAAMAALVVGAPPCLSPYGGVDAVLATRWLSLVGEAQPLLHADARWGVAYLGLSVAGLFAGLLRERRSPNPARRLLLAVLLSAILLSFHQLRAAYASAAAAVPVLAEAIGAVRRRGVLPTLAVWIGAAGITYPLAAAALPVPVRPPTAGTCDTAALRERVATLAPARVLAPIDMGPWLIAAGHHAIAGPYHRNTAGNRAALAFPTMSARARRAASARLRVDWWIACTPGPRLYRMR